MKFNLEKTSTIFGKIAGISLSLVVISLAAVVVAENGKRLINCFSKKPKASKDPKIFVVEVNHGHKDAPIKEEDATLKEEDATLKEEDATLKEEDATLKEEEKNWKFLQEPAKPETKPAAKKSTSKSTKK